ncbi:MAG TPA: CoA transferase [Candidatus Binataceae bacterium]|nr:CoA transferase [Candidatus Binataceae bacterium]
MSALQGVKVVEFGSNLGAEYAAWILAEQGARTIKVEPRDGSARRGSSHFHVLNRSKQSLFFDLHAAPERAAELLHWADVVVTGFTPANLKRLNLDPESVRRLNPRAIAVNVPPLGSRGELADFDATDDLVAAYSGITGSQWARSANPVALVFPAASYSAGVMAAMAAIASLLACRGEAVGEAVEVSLLAGAFSLQTGGIIRHEKMTRLYHGPQDPLGPIPCYRLFQAGDGRYLFAACGNSTFWGKFTLALERPDLVADPRFENAPWGIPGDQWQALKDIIEPIIRTKPRAEWLKILRDNDVPCAPVLTRQEFIDWEQTLALGMRQEIQDPTLGATVQLGLPFFLHDTPGAISGPAPARGDERTARRWIAERNGTAQSLSGGRTRPPARGPLDGIVVLDFASYIAGSYGPMILAQLGATVIKIESLEGDSFRHFGFGFLGWNQGKRGLSLNLATDAGREIIEGLARRADVVVENLRPGRMRRFGFDYPRLSSLNPRIIFMSVNAFGNHGPEHDRPGFDPLLQSYSGVMAAQGGPHGHPVYLTCAICDYGAAMISALGCVTALYARERTGRGQFCETSLLQASMALQAGEFIFYLGRPDLENGSAEHRGRAALSRAYKCRDDQWLFISLDDAGQWNSLRRACASLPALKWPEAANEPNDGKLAAALEADLATQDRAAALAMLAEARVPAVPVNHFHDLFADPQVAANELIAELQHSQWGKVWQTGALMKFATRQAHIDHAAPLLGEHTDQVLREFLCYDAAKIGALRADKIIR